MLVQNSLVIFVRALVGLGCPKVSSPLGPMVVSFLILFCPFLFPLIYLIIISINEMGLGKPSSKKYIISIV
jgi:hypothetical protein